MKFDMEYNTQRPKMSLPEYGRSVQKMIDYALTVEDKAERTKIANSIIIIMRQLAPHLKDLEDPDHKLWSHLYFMSDFKLDVDSPYPKPSPDSFQTRPDIVPYPQNKIKYGHYGKTIQLIIEKACIMEEGPEKAAFTREIANLMKRFYLTWNRDTVSDEVIIKHLEDLSNGNLKLADPNLAATGELLKQRAVPQQLGKDHQRKKHNRFNKNNKNKKRY